MSVYTELTHAEIETILADYAIGSLKAFEGIAAGIENSNFFVDTDKGRFVLTIFERMDASELDYFMALMHHLAANGLSSPDVMECSDGTMLFSVHGKQGCIISCLKGRTLDSLNIAQLESAGASLAKLHAAGADFELRRENPTGSTWLSENIELMQANVSSRYGSEAGSLILEELDWQLSNEVTGLPGGVIHADYFCDNILFEGDAVSGIIDFYYAHDGFYAMDIAIALNALAVELGDNDTARIDAFMAGYESVRELSGEERSALPVLLRLAALRFWTSRLFDAFFPREGAMTQTKDPEEYRNKLLFHRNR